MEELSAKNEEAKDTISPATSEHSDTVEDKATNTDEKKDDQTPSTEDDSVETSVAEQVSNDEDKEPTPEQSDSVVEETDIIDEKEEIQTPSIDDESTETNVKEVSINATDQLIVDESTPTSSEQSETTTKEITEGASEEEGNEISPVDNKNSETTVTEEVSKETNQESTLEGDAVKAKEDHVEDEEVDYSTLSKEELVEIIKSIAKDDNVLKADKILLAVKPHFDKFRKAEREEAKTKFLADGGEEDDFEFKHDELSNRFDANYRLIKDRKSKYFQEKEKDKDANLKKKQDLLEQIREFVDSDETNISFEKFKTYQTQWKNIGMVPHAYNKTLWANYNALMDRFYDHRSIYFELKELDRRKNLEHKLELCAKAEALAEVEHLSEALKSLNELHDEFKHLGPVPKQEQEPLWQRFKAASDVVYAKRKGYVEHLKVAQEANLIQKLELVKLIEVCTEFNSDRIKEWNEKTKEVLALQKQWEAIGGMPKERIKEVNKQFWAAFKTFFHNKGDFFKALDATRETNLQAKKVLIEKAQELKDSTDWLKTTNELIKLQNTWKETGPVPEKVRNSTYHQFKEACDYFFEQKRAQNKVDESAFVANLELKKSICEKLEALAKEGSNDMSVLRGLQEEFNNIGFVPKKDIGTIKSLYADAIDKFINAMPDIDNEERQRIRIENQLNKLANDPNAEQKIFRKEQTIRKQISKIENDISLWKNNMEFFASSKNADKVRDEFNAKIDVATKEMLNLKQQLRVLRSME